MYVNGYDELGFNCYTGGPSLGNPVLKDWRFRQALQWAVDKNKLSAIAYGGMAKPADTVITRQLLPATPTGTGRRRPTRPTASIWPRPTQLLDRGRLQAGQRRPPRPQGQADLAASLRPQQRPTGHQPAASSSPAGSADLGLKISLSTVDDGALKTSSTTPSRASSRPTTTCSCGAGTTTSTPASFAQLLHDGADQQLERLRLVRPRSTTPSTRQQATEMDQAKRLQLIYKMQQIIYQQSPYIPLAYSDDTEAWNTARWTGWVEMPARVGNVVFPPYGFETYFSVQAGDGRQQRPGRPDRRAGHRWRAGGGHRRRRALGARQAALAHIRGAARGVSPRQQTDWSPPGVSS